MVCNPALNIINPPPLPPLFAQSSPKISFGFNLPDFEDLLALIQSLQLPWPSGIISPNIDEFTRDVLDLIASLFSHIAPFLNLYKFFTAILNMIICIINVLCAFPNPFAVASALATLFTECIPAFLLLLPFLAIILMIIALILLIIKLIEYLIAVILAIIEEILRNLLILAEAIAINNAESILAATAKIANLLCLIQNLMAVFVALAAILAIIEALALLAGGLICADGTTCCNVATCPPFISEGGFHYFTGKLVYNREIGVDIATVLGIPPDQAALFNIPPTRPERHQLFDTAFQVHNFAEIITPVLNTVAVPPALVTFWPEGIVYDITTPSSAAVYTVDIRIKLNPQDFGFSGDTQGERFFKINDCVVSMKPYLGVYDFQNVLQDFNTTGTVDILGGLVFEDDGTTPFKFTDKKGDKIQARLDNFISQPPFPSTALPTVDDSVVFDNVEYTLKPGYGALMGYTIITAGCMPTVAAEKKVQNNILIAEDIRAVVDKIPPTPAGVKVPSTGILPNVAGAQACIINSLDDFRKNVSVENTAIFQANVQTCLTDLQNQALSTYCSAVIAAVSQFKSGIALDTDVQFTTRPIKTIVTLKDISATNLGGNMPVSCQPIVAALIKGEVTLGKISDFSYDSSGVFVADITSSEAGKGQLTMSFNGKIFDTVSIVNGATTIDETVINYEFVTAEVEPIVRRDSTDVAGE